MPFIDSKITVPVSDAQRENIKSRFGEAIGKMNKPESYLMDGIEDDDTLFKGGCGCHCKTLRHALFVFFFALVSIIFFGTTYIRAGEKTPGTPVIKTSVSSDACTINIRISKTKNADGYEILLKAPGSSDYESVALLKKNGKKVREISYRVLYPGKYGVKVRAYKKDGKNKVWSPASKTSKVKADMGVKVGIRFADNPKTVFTLGGKAKGESEKNPYTYKYDCDEEFSDCKVRLVFLSNNGSFDMNPVFNYAGDDNESHSISACQLGYACVAFYAYENTGDAAPEPDGPETDPEGAVVRDTEDQAGMSVGYIDPEYGKVVAVSEKLYIKSVNENGLTGFEPQKYATITFKNGYAYFGEAPVELVTDKTLVSEILRQKEDHSVYEYKGERYQYDLKDNRGPFRFVPAEWRVLKRTKKYALLMTNYILNPGAYDGYAEQKTTTWKDSCLYYMLNDSFSYKKSERTFAPILEFNDRVLMEMDIAGTKTKIGIPTKEMLTDPQYGFSKSTGADNARIVKPSKYYDIHTNHNATKGGLSVYGLYWVANEKPGVAIAVDASGKICEGTFNCNVYEIGVVNVVKVDLTQCEIVEE